MTKPKSRMMLVVCAIGAVLAGATQPALATNVGAGHDYFHTLDANLGIDLGFGLGGFQVIPLEGNPFQSNLGDTDTVVRRSGPDVVIPPLGGPSASIPIELVALQLTSAEPMDLTPLGGTGTDHLFLTLQGDRGGHLLDPDPGPASTGEMTLDFAMRTFDSSLDVFFDVRAGSADGPILFTGNDTLVATQVPWAVDLPEGWRAIPGIDDAFFAGVIGGSLIGFDQNGQLLQLRSATVLVPEPATLALLALGALGALGLVRRRRRACGEFRESPGTQY